MSLLQPQIILNIHHLEQENAEQGRLELPLDVVANHRAVEKQIATFWISPQCSE